ncbi:carbamoyltransferase HypF [Myxosarcina sp. GI1]|uniref:carbamoyltransferase HypF n=1 Tax=Myxosarcina sp. GI1 TaxID=1541065 RepID=UPI00055C3C7E|nr:carbamoyltransferase HypF [Myxosarcina sp. GI1]
MKQGLSLKIQGAVQGVGFRPFIYRLATELRLTGWVNNSSEGVAVEIEGERSQLKTFLARLKSQSPPLSNIQNVVSSQHTPIGYQEFTIKSSSMGAKTASILPDLATCAECRQEIFDPTNYRYRYPFINCTNCGSRFSIIRALPYDRSNTTMQQFAMCDRCLAEYQNPSNRRFHAQPNACPECGPHLELWDRQGNTLATHHEALLATAEAIRQGKIMAIKGLGGFHLVVDAANETAVQKLRDRKHRPYKPLALMYPNLERIKTDCHVSFLEEKLLLSPKAPIVLLKKHNYACEWVAPHNSYLGVMLPYTPLHHLLMNELDFPIVATSGNFSGEPICIDNREALIKLERIADLFLVHNRPIVRPVDDSIVRVVGGREQILRRARGYAPLPIFPSPISIDVEQNKQLLAVGGYLKNAIAFTKDNRLFLSQYIGDLETLATYERFQQTINDFQSLYELKPTQVICDRHPHYLSTNYAQKLNIPVSSVQHHYAHVLSCMVDNGLDLNEPVLGVAWDGTGYGLDGTIWGGEFLSITDTGFKRVACLRTFRLPGGERAIKEPTRIAIALLYEIFGDFLFTNTNCFNYLPWFKALTEGELKNFRTVLDKNINVPITSSMGRLFDGMAAILSICQQVSYEGQAAIELESAIADLNTEETYSFELIQPAKPTSDCSIIIDWKPIVRGILIDVANKRAKSKISAKFHNTLVEMIIAVAKQVKQKQILLTGGCWQNKYLTERAIARLKQEDFIPYWHHGIPCNDGGIAVGQIAASLRR